MHGDSVARKRLAGLRESRRARLHAAKDCDELHGGKAGRRCAKAQIIWHAQTTVREA